MKVMFEFDPKELNDAQRSRLRELLFGEPACQEEIVAPSVPELEEAVASNPSPELTWAQRQALRNRSPEEVGIIQPISPQTHIPAAPSVPELEEIVAAPPVPDLGKTEIVDTRQLDFVSSRRNRKLKTETVESPPIVEDAVAVGDDEEFSSIRILKSLAAGGAPIVSIADKDLHTACTAKMAKGIGRQDIADEIRKLIRKYVQAEGQGVVMIPQSVRADFLEKLAAL